MVAYFEQLLTMSPNTPIHFFVYVVLFVLVLVEGPFAILLASTAASTGFLNPLPVFITASLGNLVADVLWYFLGFFGKPEWLLKMKWLKLDQNKINLLTQKISKNAVKILVVAKLTNGLIVPALITTGLAKVKLRHWFPGLFFSNLLITGIFVLLGYWTAVNIMKLEHWIKYLAMGVSIVFILIISVYVQRFLKQHTDVELE